MIGVITTLKTGFGFIGEDTTKKKFYFKFSDLIRFQMIKEGYKVSFEVEEESCGDDETEWIDAMRNLFRKGRLPQAPAAHKVEILRPEPEPEVFNPVILPGSISVEPSELLTPAFRSKTLLETVEE
jgi:cold shock CspA family protein